MNKSLSVFFLCSLLSISLVQASGNKPNWQLSGEELSCLADEHDPFPLTADQQNYMNTIESFDKRDASKKKISITAAVGGIVSVIGLAKTVYDYGSGVYTTANKAVHIVDKGADILKNTTKAINQDASRQACDQANTFVKNKVEELNKWRQQEEKRIKDREDQLNKYNNVLQISFGEMEKAQSAVKSLSFTQLQMLSASELLSGSGKTYFTDLFKAETERLKQQIQKGQTEDVKFVLENMNKIHNTSNNNSRSNSPLRKTFENPNQV